MLLRITNNITLDGIARHYIVICDIVRKHGTTKKPQKGIMADTKNTKNIQVMSSKVNSEKSHLIGVEMFNIFYLAFNCYKQACCKGQRSTKYPCKERLNCS